uniref:Uncharacterized protein n=1 Tax=Sphaeramia orbicularis TaxID=375764 RepID=A0A673AVS5_9TELE
MPSAAKAQTDREPLLGRTLESSLSRILMLPLDPRPKRSQSFDMGDVTSASATQLCTKPRRISSIWTKRSLSVNGTLLTHSLTHSRFTCFLCQIRDSSLRPV